LAFAALPPAALRAAPFAAVARFLAPVRVEEGVGLCRFDLPLFLAIGVSVLPVSVAPVSVDEFL
jgi:hypothetical protein